MRQTFKHINFLHFLILLSIFNSCQTEFVEIEEPDTSETINVNDNVSALILNVILKDGSFDNVIDKCNGISIKFPYTIQVDDKLLTISSLQDINKATLNDSAVITIVFPITVVFSDYSERKLSGKDELEAIQEQFGEIVDDDIECIDFVYPIELAIYNTTYQKSSVVKVMNDQNMYDIFSQISNLIVGIKYPINLITPEGDSIQVNSKEELETEISNTIGKCDEDDDSGLDVGNENGTGDDNDDSSDTNTDSNTETNTDTDTETSTDTNTDANTDTETNTDTSTDNNTDTGTETNTDTNTDTETNTDTSADNNTSTDTQTNTDAGTIADTESDTNYENQSLNVTLTAGDWIISFYADPTDITPSFNPYVLNFGEDLTLTVKDEEGSKIFLGSWKLNDPEDDQSTLEVDIETDNLSLSKLNEAWEIISTGNDKIELQAESSDEEFIKKLTLSRTE